MNLPTFPEFRLISLEDRAAYNQFYKQFEPYSDFSFNNLWVWFNENGGLAMAEHNGNIVLRLDDPFKNGAKEYTVIGNTAVDRTMQRVLRWQRAMGLPQELVMVPEEVVRSIKNPTAFTIKEDRDNDDYVYDCTEMIKAEGHKFAGYRRALSQFKRANPNYELRDIDAQDYTTQCMLINRLHTWESTYRQDQQSRVEGAALDICLMNAQQLEVKGVGLFIDNVLEAFVLYHAAPQGDYGMLNHIKCNNNLYNISDFMIACTIEKMHDLGMRYMNFEQDLGLDGLRKYKESLRPYRYLKRFTIY